MVLQKGIMHFLVKEAGGEIPNEMWIILSRSCWEACTSSSLRLVASRLGQNDEQKLTNSGKFGWNRRNQAKPGKNANFEGKNGVKNGPNGAKNGQTKPNPGKTWQNQKFRKILVRDRPTLLHGRLGQNDDGNKLKRTNSGEVGQNWTNWVNWAKTGKNRTFFGKKQAKSGKNGQIGEQNWTLAKHGKTQSFAECWFGMAQPWWLGVMYLTKQFLTRGAVVQFIVHHALLESYFEIQGDCPLKCQFGWRFIE